MSLLTANLGFVTFNSLLAFILLNRTAQRVYVVLFVVSSVSRLEFDSSSTSFRVDTFFVHSCVRLVSHTLHYYNTQMICTTCSIRMTFDSNDIN